MQYCVHTEAPNKFHFWTAVSTIAGALRRRVWIDQSHFQWTPNFYIVFVAPPGIVSKSTTLSIGMNLLRKVPGIFFGPDAVTWQALTQSLAESTESVLGPDGCFFPMSCVTIASSEFGTFLNPKDREMVDVLVSLWDGQKSVWEKSTKTQGSDKIENPWINMAACTTPAWIAGNFPEYMIGGGFTSRCVFVYAETKRRYVAYPGRNAPRAEMSELRDLLIEDLTGISKMFGEYIMTDEAMDFGEEWYPRNFQEIPNDLNNDKFHSYFARKQGHVHKLAMILAAAESDELIITQRNLDEAIQIVTSLEAEMAKVFSNIGMEGDARKAAELVSVVKAYPSISDRDLFKILFKSMSYQEYQACKTAAIAAGLIGAELRDGEWYLFYKGAKVVHLKPDTDIDQGTS